MAETKKTGKAKLLVDAEDEVERQMNLNTIMRTMQKLKASTIVLIGQDTETVAEINKVYLRNCTLESAKVKENRAAREARQGGGYALAKFLDRDEK